MAVTATLVYTGRNFLRYRIAQDGAAGTTLTITTTGAASPDLLTDSLAGPLKSLAKAFTQGFGAFAAGALTQAQARALWLSDWGGADPGNKNQITARCDVQTRGLVAGGLCAVDANVDGSGHPTINLTTTADAATWYLDVKVPNAIGA